MILPCIKNILIIPDFGKSADDVELYAIKEAVEASETAEVHVVDLRKMVLEEYSGKELNDTEAVELAARKLEAIANGRHSGSDEPERIIKTKGGLTIHVTKSSGEGAFLPNAIIVFGRSAMLADGVGSTDVLFINPEYDDAWPWKKQYYSGRETAKQYYAENLVRHNLIETAYSFGNVNPGQCDQPSRYAIFTTPAKANMGEEYLNRYPRLSMIDTSLDSNPEAVAKLICSFADREMDIPLVAIDNILADFPCEHQWPEICRFPKPIQIDGVTALGLERGKPMEDGQSELKVSVNTLKYPLPIELFRHYEDLSTLRNAVAAACKEAKAVEDSIKRIMIVPDYFTPHDNPAMLELREKLREKGYQVTIFCSGNTLEKTRQGLERVCKKRRYDLIVAFETGCLLAARLSGSNRIYINPDWAAWEWMKKMLGEDDMRNEKRDNRGGPIFSYCIDKNEIAMARDMGAKYNIRNQSDKFSTGWFTPDEMNSHLPEEHQKRFGSAVYPPHIGLDTECGIAAIANEIDKTMKSATDYVI